MEKIEQVEVQKQSDLILAKIKDYLDTNPSARFGQALFNLHINIFENEKNPEKADYALKDIYNYTDKKNIRYN